MKIRMIDDDTYFFGAPVDIARRLRGRAHTKARDLDGYMQKVASEYGFDLVGDTLEERCDAFLVGMIRQGPARPVVTASADMYAVRVLRKVLGLSREKLAQLLGVSLMTVNRWETGEHAIASDRFESIKRVLFDPTSRSDALPAPDEVTARAGQSPARSDSLLGTRQRVRQRMQSIRTQPVWTRSV
jgi:transcriptional regulator with XRE-family HTH domain